MNSKELRAKRAQLVKDAQAIIGADNVSPEDMARADAMLDESDRILKQVESVERAERLALESGLAASSAGSERGGVLLPFNLAREREIVGRMLASRNPARFADLAQADRDYVAESLAREKRILRAAALACHFGAPLSNFASAEDVAHYHARFQAAGNEATNTAGGYTVAPLFEADLLIAMKAYGNMRGVSRVISTSTGATLPWPTMDDTGNVASIITTENTQVSADTDLAFNQVSIGAWTYKSGYLPVSVQLLQDSVFDFDSLIRDAIAIRFARGQNAHFTTGTGSSQPKGVVTAATLGVTGASGQTTSLIIDNLFDLVASIDPAYRAGAQFMAADPTWQALRKLKDTLGRPLWEPSLTAGVPDMLIGYPYVTNQQVPQMAASAKSVLFGNFSNYLIRDTLGMQMLVLRERFADYLQVAWMAYMRSDGNLICSPTVAPIKYFQHPAS